MLTNATLQKIVKRFSSIGPQLRFETRPNPKTDNFKLQFVTISVFGNMWCAWDLTRTTFLTSIFAKFVNQDPSTESERD